MSMHIRSLIVRVGATVACVVLAQVVLAGTMQAGASRQAALLGNLQACKAFNGLPPASSDSDQVRVPAGSFVMGSDGGYPEEAPARSVKVGSFMIDRYDVTNAEFARFVAATGYKTL
ncbi:SUMF1/EgtB/PvdO family nonheme iron enzyme, partial [Paraburkholderia sp.]|uniref:SUMF1/EgtB/PvdO family nonheme iron enzyme n=1 Tax=Paraburkholderia sp. TaxID=1926495 RepID=UPI002D539915